MSDILTKKAEPKKADALIVGRVALRFSERLKKELGDERFAALRLANGIEQDKAICHSHNFCDSNMVMLETVKEVLGREVDVSDNEIVELMNSAWDMAKRLYIADCPEWAEGLLRVGFRVEGTGGGCTAWRKDFPDGSYVLITDDISHVLDRGVACIGIYDKEGYDVICVSNEKDADAAATELPGKAGEL